MKILILGGTGEARLLANRLVAMGHEVTSSLAGRTSEPRLPEGNVRVGGFGGIWGLAAYLKAGAFDRLVDATHPYAGLISINAVAAARESDVPLLRLVRPAWVEPDGAHWIGVPDIDAAAAALPRGARVLVTTGHGGLDQFLKRHDCRLLVRLIEPPQEALPPHAQLLLDHPPFTLEGELALMKREDITHLVTKNSGGSQTAAKLDAAQRLGVTVIMVERPIDPPAEEVCSVDEAIAALHLD